MGNDISTRTLRSSLAELYSATVMAFRTLLMDCQTSCEHSFFSESFYRYLLFAWSYNNTKRLSELDSVCPPLRSYRGIVIESCHGDLSLGFQPLQ
jgi:hypothetical protein